MKKGRIVLLILILLIGIAAVIIITQPQLLTNLFVSAHLDQKDEEKSPVITHQELSIELTEDFHYISVKSSSSYKVYSGEGYVVEIERVAHSSITPKEGYDFPSLTVFMDIYLSQFAGNDADALEFVTEGDLLCVDGDSNGDGEADTFIVLFETANAFWDIRFSSSSKDYATVRADGLKWAKTVTFAE